MCVSLLELSNNKYSNVVKLILETKVKLLLKTFPTTHLTSIMIVTESNGFSTIEMEEKLP